MKTLLSLIFAVCLSPIFAQTNAWLSTNGPLGGDVMEIILADDGALIAGMRLGGMYRSHDSGQNWEQIPATPGAPWLFSGVFDFAKNADGDLFAATNYGCYRSTDNGQTWTAFTEGLTNTYLVSLFVDEEGLVFAGSYNQGIFKSEDNGESWTSSSIGLLSGPVFALAKNSAGDLFAGVTSGLFRSADNGSTWTQLSNGLDNNYILKLFLTNDDSLIVGTINGAFLSSDNGENFSKPVAISGGINLIGQSPGGRLYCGNTAGFLFTAQNFSSPWESTGDKIYPGYLTSIQFASEDEFIVSALEAGIYHTKDKGANWEAWNNGMTAIEATHLRQIDDGTLFLASKDGVFYSNDMGENWVWDIQNGFGSDIRAIEQSPSGRMFASMGGSLVFSDDRGQSWARSDSLFLGIYPESIAFGSDNSIFVGQYGKIFKSPDDGETWLDLNLEMPETAIQCMLVTENGTVLAGTRTESIWRSIDGGETWARADSGTGNFSDVTRFIQLENGDILHAAFDGVFRSSDEGLSWTQTSPPPTYGLKDLVVDHDGNFFIATRGGGIYVSEDAGVTWKSFNTGLTNLDATSLLVDNENNLYTASRGSAVYKTKFTPTSTSVNNQEIQIPASIQLEQNYPNPFNPETRIKYHLSEMSKVTLSIFNQRGQLIKQYELGELSAGEHEIVWDGKDESKKLVANGIYLYQIKAGNHAQSRKMVLLK